MFRELAADVVEVADLVDVRAEVEGHLVGLLVAALHVVAVADHVVRHLPREGGQRARLVSYGQRERREWTQATDC